jgi:hypothetical protein
MRERLLPVAPIAKRRDTAADDPAATLWRYIDLAKFIDLLDARRLHLTRLDRLGDPYEGTAPAGGRDGPLEALRAMARRARRAAYVSSWYLGEDESEAMWRLYCPGGQGVALRTRYAQLEETAAAHPHMHVGRVRYIDYDADPLPAPDLLAPVLHKRVAFAHEREVRLIAVLPQALDDPRAGGPPSLEIEWDPERFVDRIHIDPYADDHFAKAVRAVVRRMAPALEPRLVWSRLTVAPLV